MRVNRNAISTRARLVAVLAAAGLAACGEVETDTPTAQATVDPVQTESAAPTPAPSTVPAFRAGAHGAKDPHAALTPDKLIQVALQHRAEGRMAEAIDALDRAVGRYADHASLLAVRASLNLERGETAAALADLESAVRLEPENPAHRVNRAQAYRQFGRPSEALKDLDQAIEIDPDLVAARFNRSALLLEKADFKAALADLDHCITVDPHAPAPYFNRAAAYHGLGSRQAAIADLEHFLELADSESWKSTANDLLANWREEGSAKSTSADTQ